MELRLQLRHLEGHGSSPWPEANDRKRQEKEKNEETDGGQQVAECEFTRGQASPLPRRHMKRPCFLYVTRGVAFVSFFLIFSMCFFSALSCFCPMCCFLCLFLSLCLSLSLLPFFVFQSSFKHRHKSTVIWSGVRVSCPFQCVCPLVLLAVSTWLHWTVGGSRTCRTQADGGRNK